jgi:hypothetical protein
MTFTQSSIARAHALAAQFGALFAHRAATDHPLEKSKIEEQIVALIREGNDNSVINLAHEIIDAKIDAKIVAFVDATANYFDSGDRVFKAAEGTDLVLRLQRVRSALMESPSVAMAENLQRIFEEFSQANPLSAENAREAEEAHSPSEHTDQAQSASA